MGFEEEVDLYHKMTPPPNLGHSWVVFEEWSQILSSTKLLRLGFEQSCSAMATQKLEEKVKQHDEVVESSKTDCRSQSRAHGKAFRCVGISINFGSRHKTVLFSVFWVLCILLCGVSNVFVCYKHGDGRDFPQPRFGRGSVMNNSRGKCKILEGSVMKIPSRHIPHTSGPIQWARSDVGLKPSAAARPVRWCSCIPATEPVLQSLHYARSVIGRSCAALCRDHVILFNKIMEPKGCARPRP